MSITVTHIQYHRQTAQLTITFNDGISGQLTAEFLRVHSPSITVTGHHSSQAQLVTNKRGITIEQLNSIGNYAVKLTFSDGHHSGIYTWTYLHKLVNQQHQLWQCYLDKLKHHHSHRDQLISIKSI